MTSVEGGKEQNGARGKRVKGRIKTSQKRKKSNATLTIRFNRLNALRHNHRNEKERFRILRVISNLFDQISSKHRRR